MSTLSRPAVIHPLAGEFRAVRAEVIHRVQYALAVNPSLSCLFIEQLNTDRHTIQRVSYLMGDLGHRKPQRRERLALF